MVQRVLDIIAYFQPIAWAFENPRSGLLKGRAVVAGLAYKDISYCAYGYPYRKQTRIWTCVPWNPKPMCCKRAPCASVRDGRHAMTAQRAPGKKGGVRDPNDKCSLQQLYSMPSELCDEIALAFSRAVA